MAEETQIDSFGFNWGKAKPLEPGAGSFYGDHFPEGPRYRFKVSKLAGTKNKDTGKVRILVEAVCVDGQGPASNCIGRTLKNTFNMPLDSEADDPKKTFGAQLFHSFIVACGHKVMEDGAQVPFNKLLGDEFEATTKDYSTKENVKVDAEGREKRYPSKLTSQIRDVYRVGTTGASVANTPAEPPKSDEFQDFK